MSAKREHKFEECWTSLLGRAGRFEADPSDEDLMSAKREHKFEE